VKFRRRWMGPKHGIARGVAVYGTSDSGRIELVDGLLPDFGRRLKGWAISRGVVLTDDLAGLETLDAHLSEWLADPTHYDHVDLGNEVGIYLGNVMVKNLTDAKWKLWPNGHPVIALAPTRELDVIAIVGDRISKSTPSASLSSIYTSAT
jgi:Family of unknown function (DUF6278)